MTQPTLSQVCFQIVDCEHKTAPTDAAGTHPLVRTPDIAVGRLLLDQAERISESTYRDWTKRAVPQPGDLILAREAPVGNVGIIPPGAAPALGQRTVLIRPDPSQVDAHYLNYLISSPGIRAWMDGVSAGATVPHLNVADIRALPLPELPPLPTQRKIAAILSAYDDLIENNRRRIEILEEMMQRIHREWFVEFRFPGRQNVPYKESPNGPIPDGWDWQPLGSLAEDMRRSVQPQSVPGDTPYFGLEHLPERSIALGEWGRADEVTSTKYLFEVGEILFGKIRPYFHKVGPPPVSGICSTDAIVIRPRATRVKGLVLATVSSDAFVNHAAQTSQGTKMPRADWQVLKDYPVPVPREYTVLEEFEMYMDEYVRLIHNFIFANRTLHASRDLLLPRLISGEIDVENLDIVLEGAAA